MLSVIASRRFGFVSWKHVDTRLWLPNDRGADVPLQAADWIAKCEATTRHTFFVRIATTHLPHAHRERPKLHFETNSVRRILYYACHVMYGNWINSTKSVQVLNISALSQLIEKRYYYLSAILILSTENVSNWLLNKIPLIILNMSVFCVLGCAYEVIDFRTTTADHIQ